MLGDEQYRRDLVLGHPIELLDAGQLSLVSEVVAASDGDGEAASGAGDRRRHRYALAVARLAMECLEGRGERLPSLAEDIPPARTEDERLMRTRAGLMVYSRRLHSGLPDSWPNDAATRLAKEAVVRGQGLADHLGDALLAHVSSRRLLLEGQPFEAFRTLVTCGARTDGTTLCSVLLEEDLEVARMLVGDPRAPLDERSARQADSFCERSGLRDLLAKRRGVGEIIASVERGLDEVDGLDALLARDSRRNDDLDRAWALVVASMSDIRRGAGKRALIRARQAEGFARAGGATACTQYAHLLRLVAELRLGERPSSDALSLPRGGSPSESAGLLAMVLVGLDGPGAELERLCSDAAEVSCDPYVALVLDLLTESHIADAGRLGRLLPASWKEVVASIRARRELSLASRNGPRLALRASEGPEAPQADEDDSGILEVSLMGGFSVRLGGVVIPQRAWHRKAATSMLALLALSRGHGCTRSELVEALWPGRDYAKARNGLSVATSAIKRTLGQVGGATRYLVSTEESVGLNMDNVRVDIDLLEERCRKMMAGGDDDAVTLELCREAEALYGGELYVPEADSTGRFAIRREQVRKEFVDAAVMGSRAAMGLGRYAEALYHARNAQDASPLREDALECVMASLGALGRDNEAVMAYEGFAEEVICGTGMPPSARLRGIFSEARAAEERRGRSVTDPTRRKRQAEDDEQGRDAVTA